MLGQVVVGTVGHAPQLAPAEGEEDTRSRWLPWSRSTAPRDHGHAAAGSPPVMPRDSSHSLAEAAPVVEPLQIGARLAEELQLHLLELTDAEDEVAGGDLIAEGLADLANAEGQLFPGGTLHIYEVDENALRSFGTEINGVLCVLGHALEGLEHQVKLTDIGEVVLAAGGAGDVVLLDDSPSSRSERRRRWAYPGSMPFSWRTSPQ